MATDDRTATQDLPRPHIDNTVAEDMARLILTVDLIDGLLASIISDLTGKAPAAHGHAIGDITGLQSALDAKAAGSHTHAISALSDVLTTGIAIGQILMWNGTAFQPSAVPAGDWPTITNKPTDLAGFGLSAEVTALLDNLIAAAPGSLDTLNELAAALGDDPNFAATMTAALAGKADATATTAALALKAAAAIQIIAGTGLLGGGTLEGNRTLALDFADQATAEAGTDATKAMNPLRVAQAIAALAGTTGFTEVGAGFTPSGGVITISGISAAAKEVLLISASVTASINGTGSIRVGGASGLVTSGYLSAGSATSLTSLNAIFFSTGRDFCMSLKKGPGTEWLMEVSGGGGNSSPGLVDVGEALTQVELDVVSGTLNAGTVYAFERV